MEKNEKFYEKIGLRCGLEIHQRLDTKKMFCKCDSGQKEEVVGEIKRKLRVVPSELGEFDPAALFEFLRDKTFVYKISPKETCLVETDEEPPHPLNEDALKIALQICLMLKCKIPDEIHIMRKTVIDGSNTGGFQRTAVIGLNGELETSFGTIKIPSVCLEEEAARIEERSNGKVIYRLSGLGIPLIEISTSSDIHSPEEAKEVAEKIGLILRSTKVQRGIGSIRQDINISIKDGARVEIKGFQELERIPKLIENEIARQIALLEIKSELKRRGLQKFGNQKDVTNIFKKTRCELLRKILLDGGKVLAIKLPKFAGLFKKQCGDRTFGREINAYAEAHGLGIIHSDEDLSRYNLQWEFRQLFDILDANPAEQDLVLIIAGKSPNVDNAMSSVFERAKHCLIGVPEETRVSDNLGSKYTRPLPGAERMYPETDIPPIRVDEELLSKIEVPTTLVEKEKILRKKLPEDLARQIIKSRYFPIYEELSEKFDQIMVASTFVSTLKNLKRQGYETDKLTKDDFFAIFSLVKEEKIAKDVLPDALILRIEGKTIKEIETKFRLIGENELRNIIKEVVRKHPKEKESVLMGLIMKKLRGKARGEKVVKILREML